MKTYASIAALGLLLAAPALADDQSSAGIHSGVNSGGATTTQDLPAVPNTAAGAGTGGIMDSGGAASDQTAATDSLPRSGGEKTGEPGAGTSMSPSAIEKLPPVSEKQQTSAVSSGADADLGSDKSLVRKLQTELKDAGYDVGAVDGILGPQTSQALMKYQQDNGMPATGRIDENTLAKMDIQSPQQAASPSGSQLDTDAGTRDESR